MWSSEKGTHYLIAAEGERPNVGAAADVLDASYSCDIPRYFDEVLYVCMYVC